jgi:type IV secretion/conjugal transfer VirB4 family ATPase
VSRDRTPGMAEGVAWTALIDDGIVQDRYGGLLAGWFYAGPDTASSTPAKLNNLSFRANQAMRRFGGGFASWTEAARLEAAGYPPPEASFFPDSVSRMLDDERREQFAAEGKHFESHKAFLLYSLPPLRRYSRIAELVYTDEGNPDRSIADRILEQFKRDLIDFESAVGGALTMQRMASYPILDSTGRRHFGDQLVNYLNFCLTGEVLSLQIPDDGAFLSKVLGFRAFDHGLMPRHGKNFIATVRVCGFPEQTFPQILDALDGLEIPYRWSTRMIYLDRAEAVKELNDMRAKWEAQQRGFFAQLFKSANAQVNLDAVAMVKQADASLKLAESGEYKFGYHSPVVVLMDPDPDRLEDKARLVAKAIQQQHFDAFVDDVNTTEAWRGSLPGHVKPNVWRPMVHTGTLSDLLPLSSVWTGTEIHPNPLYPPNAPPLLYARTTGATPFRISLHSRDVGHTLIFGPIGSGKSTLLALIMVQFLRYPGATVMAFDKGRSLKTAARACGGLHYDIGSEDSPQFCPLSMLDTPLQRAESEAWVAGCFELQHGRQPVPEERAAVQKALRLMSGTDMRSLSHFCATVQNKAVQDALRYYTLDGPMGYLYDGVADGTAQSHLIVHEIGELMKLPDVASAPLLLYMIRQFDRSLHGQPALLAIDEGWLLLSRMLTKPVLIDWFKTKRKEVCQVIMATQSLSDAARSGILDILLESCPNIVFGANPEATNRGDGEYLGPYDFYKMLGRNDTEIALIQNLIPKREYYFTSPEGSRPGDLGLGAKALAICGVSDPKDLDRIADLEQHYGEEWVNVWIEERTSGVRKPLLQAAE